MGMMRSIPRLAIAMLAGLVSSGCLAAAGAAGAAGAIAYTQRGAETRLDASVAEIGAAAEAVYGAMEIRITRRSSAEDGSESELTGMRDEMEVVVRAEAGDDGLTHVQVTAREGVVEYDRDYAEEVLRRIVEAV
jgi:hypothetical protein